MSINRDSVVAIIGAGAMGSGIAQVASQAGHPVVVVDSVEDAHARSRAGIAKGLDKRVERGKMAAADRDAILGRIQWTSDLSAVAPAALVIEAIVENQEAKAGLFETLSTLMAPDAVLASNTSSLSIDDLAATVKAPERFVGLHFFNPVPVMKLVELIAGKATDESVAADLLALMQQWGKVAVRVRDVPGFIVNRVARPYYAEGFAALGEGIDAAAIDEALTGAGAFRMGPLTLADMIGHDVNYVVAQSVYDAYDGNTRFRPQPSQKALYDGGALGRKSGSGVYDYSVALPDPAFLAPGTVDDSVSVAEAQDGIAPLVELLRNASVAVSTDADCPEGSVKYGGVVMALGDGRPLAARAGVDVLIDRPRDFDAARTLVVTCADEQAERAAATLAQLLGKQAIAIPDRPGQIVLRTLAQLANAAADAVCDGVADAKDIDDAMRFGANHPEGPLEWAGRFGHAPLAKVLSNIADATGDAMYQPSRLFAAEDALPS